MPEKKPPKTFAPLAKNTLRSNIKKKKSPLLPPLAAMRMERGIASKTVPKVGSNGLDI